VVEEQSWLQTSGIHDFFHLRINTQRCLC